jgi:hypothetical protein
MQTPTFTMQRPAMSLIELTVAATLIISGMAVIGKLTVATGRVWQQSRYERLAMEELSNQLERYTALWPDLSAEQRSEIAPSPEIADRLPGATLTLIPIQDALGTRLEMQIDWDRGVLAVPITLVAWIDPAPSDQTGLGEELP